MPSVIRLLVFVIVLGAALTAHVSAALATFPGANGKIAFSSQRDGNDEIYSMNPDGSAQTRLTNLAAEDIEPAWNQSGDDLAFASDRGDFQTQFEMFEIFRLHVADSTVTRLTFNSSADHSPSWSPSGTQLAVQGSGDIVLVAADGSGTTTNLTGGQPLAVEEAPDWSPDGQRVVFTASTGNPSIPDVFSINVDGTGLLNLTNSPTIPDLRPNWSPDGTKIAFSTFRNSNFEIYTMNATGGGETNVSNFPGAHDGEPAWSPDGTKIAFVSRREFNNDDIYVMPSAGGFHTRLTSAAGPDVSPDWQRVDPPPPPACSDSVDNDGDTKIDFPADPGCASSADDSEVDQPPAPTTYARPKGATPFRVPLVVAYNQCNAPNRTHGPPLAFPSCNPPVQASTAITVGTPDANGAAANSESMIRMDVLVGNAAPPDDSDVLIQAVVEDVRCKAGTTACGNENAADGADYTGQLQGNATVRITDRFNAVSPGGGPDPATIVDIPFPLPMACGNTASTAEGGLCSMSATSMNAIVPGMVKDRKRAIFEMGQVAVFDGGADGQNGTTPNTLFMVQGTFVP